ncbi:MAG: 23S rRNA (uracil(1939)-C(5))-methyltransferase RlmD [Clostridia bacterium]|nr:23S rRNA (uracil(1939)-C(5))-methyltransferase RlmD [Clostridia bacterium]
MENTKYCQVCKKCSGCQLSNMDYQSQVKYKQSNLRRTFGSLIKPQRIIEADSPLNYRNKAQIVFKKEKGKTRFGIYQSAEKGIVLTNNCPLHTDTANEISRTLCRLFDRFSLSPFDFKRRTGYIRSVVIREGFMTGEVLLNIVASKNTFPKEKEFAKAITAAHPSVKSIIISESQSLKLTSGGNERVIFGDGFITDTLCSLDFKIGYNTFYQINPVQTEKLYNRAIKMADLKETDKVLDAYCGIGTISLAVAGKCSKVTGIELNESSIENAKENAKLNGITNAVFYANDVKKQIRTLLSNGETFDVCFVDPPRMGCDIEFLKSIINADIPRIVYVSCNTQTQIRDVRFLIKNGYKPEKQQGVDLFPYTKHIESIVLLQK